ncbi:IS66 family insertion sequence element accessory protein TnpA [Alicyclobacillus suci]|uniref:IS66 family insertion sequence element accessory protein TnpA n=1 Tax=Alicyclobacillus suci TaxID=2816080 RepID=UPI001A8CCAAE|nr:hypothetical protein [Alicyclobacillus suci]
MSRTDLHDEWEKRLIEFESSGQTTTAWCAAQEINIHRFRYWSSKLRGNRRQKPLNGESRSQAKDYDSVENLVAALDILIPDNDELLERLKAMLLPILDAIRSMAWSSVPHEE